MRDVDAVKTTGLVLKTSNAVLAIALQTGLIHPVVVLVSRYG